MNLQELLDHYQCLIMPGFDDALLGVATQFNKTFAVYDELKIIQILVEQGMSQEDAWDYYSFNIAGAFLGDSTPAFLSTGTP